MRRPWYIVGIINLVGIAATVLVLFNILGDKGFPRAADGGPANGPLAFTALLLFGGLLIFVGMNGVIRQHAFSASDDREFTGTKARIIGALQCLGGVIPAGAAIYGFLFS